MDSVRVTHSRPPDHAPWRLGALDCWADLQRRWRVLALGDVPGLVRAEEVAGCCLFLSSDLSSYCTGTEVDPNGGLHIH